MSEHTDDSKQHYIELDNYVSSRGHLYAAQLISEEWILPLTDAEAKQEAEAEEEEEEEELKNIENEDNNETNETELNDSKEKDQLFTTEVNEEDIENAKDRSGLKPRHKMKRMSSVLSSVIRSGFGMANENKSFTSSFQDPNYYNQKPHEIKEELIERAKCYYEESTEHFNEGNFERTISLLNKAFTLNSFNIQFYLLKIESFIQLCDYKSALITINKLLSILSVWSNNESSYNDLKINLLNKTAFCHFAQGQTFFDYKLYLEALESFNKASELLPNIINYKIRSIVCLYSLGRLHDAISYINKIIGDPEAQQYKANLLILRARINIKSYNLTEGFHDLKDAIEIEPNNHEANNLLGQIQDTADRLRNSALSLSFQDRIQEAVNKMTGAITMNPVNPEYNLQRGILYKKLQDFNSAIDDFLLGLDKINHDEKNNPILFKNFQRHILLTYNDFAIVCYKKKLYDDAITLLNKAIKLEKNETGFYINRGDCFFKKNEIHFALGDYEQAVEINPNDEMSRERVGVIHHYIAIEKYNEKNYEESTNFLNTAIKYSPDNCKYYISRARTYFMIEEIKSAQLDICTCILLDPTNPEIPKIMPRIFENKNLSDVLQCPQMNEARRYLNSIGIKSVLDSTEEATKLISEEKPKKVEVVSNIFPNINSVREEHNAHLDLINKKRDLKRLLKEQSSVKLKTEKPTLKPIYTQNAPISREPNAFYWKKFNGGIGTKD